MNNIYTLYSNKLYKDFWAKFKICSTYESIVSTKFFIRSQFSCWTEEDESSTKKKSTIAKGGQGTEKRTYCECLNKNRVFHFTCCICRSISDIGIEKIFDRGGGQTTNQIEQPHQKFSKKEHFVGQRYCRLDNQKPWSGVALNQDVARARRLNCLN